jgi:hypothetical protein
VIRFPWHKLDADERIGAPILIRELGIWTALKVGRRVRRELKSGAPFVHMEPAANERDRLSRGQIGRAIVLYSTLQRYRSQEQALRLTRAIVVEAACVFLGEQIGSLSRASLANIPQPERRGWVEEKGSRFFNATMRWDRVDDRGVDFTVTACAFPPLCVAAGVPELAPIFCAGDAKFFGAVEPNVMLDRPKTIADGDECCVFRLRFAESSDGAA